MIASVQNIIIEAGATFARDIALTDQNGQPLDVSGYTANAAMVREYFGNTQYTFETNLTTGNLNLRMEANATAMLQPGKYVYDATLSNGTDTFRIVEGIAEVDPGVTGITISS